MHVCICNYMYVYMYMKLCMYVYVAGFWKNEQIVTLGLFHFIGPDNSCTNTLFYSQYH